MGKPIIFVFTTAYSPFIGGAEVAIKEVAERLKDKYDFLIFTSRMRRDLPKREVRDEGLVVRIGFGNRFDKFWLMFFGAFYALRFLRPPAVLWAMDFSFGAAAAGFLKIFYPCLAGRQAKIPLVFTIQYGYGDERIKSGRGGLMNLAFRLILTQADYVTAISSYLLKLCSQYGFIGEAEVIHNGVDFEKFRKIVEPTSLPHSLKKGGGMGEGYPAVITVSRLVPKNGVDILIKAVAELKKEIPDIKLYIVGDGPERKNLEFYVTNFKLQDSVRFFGSVPYDEIPKYLAQADIFARPSRSEGMGNAFVEALAAGLPIVGTPVGGILDIIKDGETGLFAKVDDPKDLADKIKILLEDKKLVAQIVENGRKMVEERFSWDKISESYTDVFNNKLNAKKRILIATGIFPPDIGGPATYSKILLDELPKRDLGVRVLSFGSVRHLPKIVRHLAYGLRLMAYGRNADIIFAQDPVSVGLPAALVAKILRKRFLLKMVGDYAWEQGVQRFGVKEVLDDFLKSKYRWEVEILCKIQKFVANRADKIIVPSKYLKRVVEKWGIDLNKIVVIYNSFTFPQYLYYLADRSGEREREITGLRGKKVIVSAGRLVPWKGFDVLIDIMPDLLKLFADLKLIIIGDGPEKKYLGSKVADLKLNDAVNFTGNLPRYRVLEYLKSANIFVLNTAYEGFSHQILEAMAIGTLVVTTDSGGNTELIKNGESGILFKFNDTKAIKNIINSFFLEGTQISIMEDNDNAPVFQMNEKYRRMAENAKKKAQEFSDDRMIKETIKILT